MFFLKSRRMASLCIPLSILCARLSMGWISCVSVERCFLNPCCASWRMLVLHDYDIAGNYLFEHFTGDGCE